MLKSILNLPIFGILNKDIYNPSHAYLFYGEDELFNIEFAKVFIASIFCGKPACFQCESCRRIELTRNPDLLIIDKSNLQVADIESIIENVQLKPMIYDYKIVFITNAEGINDSAQNKLLKTLEEPNPHVIFVLTCTNVDKLLPTIKSRLNKHYLPTINLDLIANDLKLQGINIDKFSHCDITLTDAIKYSSTDNNELIYTIEHCMYNLKSSKDIPQIVGNLKIAPEQRKEFLKLLLKMTDCSLTGKVWIFDPKLIEYIRSMYSLKVLIKMMKLIDKAYNMVESNVNFNYVMDKLFYDILKEKYLCK